MTPSLMAIPVSLVPAPLTTRPFTITVSTMGFVMRTHPFDALSFAAAKPLNRGRIIDPSTHPPCIGQTTTHAQDRLPGDRRRI